MTPSCSELLTDLYAAGLRLWVEPSGLAVGPRAKMTPELRARVQAHRSELATFVSPGQPAPELHERLHAIAARATAAVRTSRPCGPARCWHPGCTTGYLLRATGKPSLRWCSVHGIEPVPEPVAPLFVFVPRPVGPGCNHIDPTTWVERDGRARCPGCDKFMGCVKEPTNDRQTQRQTSGRRAERRTGRSTANAVSS